MEAWLQGLVWAWLRERAAERGRADAAPLFLKEPRHAELGELGARTALEQAGARGVRDPLALELRWSADGRGEAAQGDSRVGVAEELSATHGHGDPLPAPARACAVGVGLLTCCASERPAW